MKIAIGSAVRLAALGGLLVTSLSFAAGGPANAAIRPSARVQAGFTLPLSPISASTLVAQAIHSGTLHPAGGAAAGNASPDLSCGTPPCVLPNAQASGGGQPVNEDPIVVNSANPRQWLTGGNDYNCSTLQGFYTSNNSGSTWTHTCMNALSGASGDGDPGVGYDTAGTAYISGIDSTSSGWNIVFEKSTNNGTTWSAPLTAVTPYFSGGQTDKDWLQVDTNASSPHKNNLYISVTQFEAGTNDTIITVSHSSNGGASWTMKAVDTKQIYPAIDQFSDLAVGKDGTVYATWMRCTANGPASDCGGTNATMEFAKSTDGGNTWSAPVTVATVALAPDNCGAFYGCLPNTSERVSNIPAVDVDNSTGAHAGNLYVIMTTYTGSHLKVQVATSTNGGSSWGAPVLVAPRTITHDQFFPWLTVSPTGAVGATWLDRRNDTSNISYEPYAAFSLSGAHFGTNIQLSTSPSNPNNDGFGGSFMGDYTGNYWKSGTTLAMSWMDSRNGVNMQDEVGGYKR